MSLAKRVMAGSLQIFPDMTTHMMFLIVMAATERASSRVIPRVAVANQPNAPVSSWVGPVLTSSGC